MEPNVIGNIDDSRDRDFMEMLYASYGRLMYSEIRKIVRDPWDVEDIQQIVILKLLDKNPLLRTLDRARLVNYIISTSRNTSYNYMHDKQRHAQEYLYDRESDFFDDAYELDDRLLMIEALEDIGEAWRALDSRSRRILEMKYILDESNEEIARALGVTPNSVRMLLTRARNRLRINLQTRGGTEEL